MQVKKPGYEIHNKEKISNCEDGRPDGCDDVRIYFEL